MVEAETDLNSTLQKVPVSKQGVLAGRIALRIIPNLVLLRDPRNIRMPAQGSISGAFGCSLIALYYDFLLRRNNYINRAHPAILHLALNSFNFLKDDMLGDLCRVYDIAGRTGAGPRSESAVHILNFYRGFLRQWNEFVGDRESGVAEGAIEVSKLEDEALLDANDAISGKNEPRNIIEAVVAGGGATRIY